MAAPDSGPSLTQREWIIACAAAMATFVLRMIRIRALPIFNDEAIYLRWGQLIAGDFRDWVALPLVDPKPPLHTLLLAIGGRVVPAQPVLVGRTLSAVFGALAVLAAAVLLRRLGGSMAGLAFFAVCPMLAFYQRLALADAMFMFLSVCIVCTALRLDSWRDALILGITMGLAMMTRQVFSYALWLVVAACVVVTPGRVRSRVLLCCAALAIAVALWSPYLLSSREMYEASVLRELRRRVFYNPQFSSATSMEIIARNIRDLVVPAFSRYVTVPLTIAAVVSFVVLVLFRRRTFLVLLIWWLAMLVPVVVAPIAYSRYVLGAVPPMMIATGVALALIHRQSLQAVCVVVLCLLPVRDLWRQIAHWDRQTLTADDRWQYVSGWPAGYATEKAVTWLRARAGVSPVVIVTSEEWGNPADAIWLSFAPMKDVKLYFVRSQPNLAVIDTAVFAQKWRDQPARLPRDLPVYYVTRRGDTPAFIAPNLILEDPVEIVNPAADTGETAGGVVIYHLR